MDRQPVAEDLPPQILPALVVEDLGGPQGGTRIDLELPVLELEDRRSPQTHGGRHPAALPLVLDEESGESEPMDPLVRPWDLQPLAIHEQGPLLCRQGPMLGRPDVAVVRHDAAPLLLQQFVEVLRRLFVPMLAKEPQAALVAASEGFGMAPRDKPRPSMREGRVEEAHVPNGGVRVGPQRLMARTGGDDQCQQEAHHHARCVYSIRQETSPCSHDARTPQSAEYSNPLLSSRALGP